MQREHIRRGFSIYVHQKVVLEIDFSGSLWGYTELTIVPESKDLKTVHLNSRQCTIHTVTVASEPADFVHNDPLSNLHISKPQDCHTHPELKRQVYSALAEGDEGELSIGIPKDVIIRQIGHATNGGIASEAATPEPQTPSFAAQPTASMFEFSPVVIRITYSLRNPADGIQFVLPSDAYPYRVPHLYTTPPSPDSARCWVPCIDNLWEKCTWDFEFVVPRYLEQNDGEQSLEDEGEPEDGDYPTVVVCSGELLEQVSHPHNSGKTIFIFSQPSLTSVQHIAWAAGPFHVHTIPADLSSAEDTSGSSQPLMHAFCLPGQESLLTASITTMRTAMSFYSTEFGSYPFGSYKLVFVDEMPTQRFDAATLSIVTLDLLHGEDAIDQVYETRLCLGHALASQWMGVNIQPKTWSDLWLVNGLGLYITGLLMRKIFGNNEYRFRLKRDMDRVIELDQGTMPPVCQPQHPDPPDAHALAFINLKAPLIMHILDRRLGKSGTSLGLSRVLPKVFLSAISGEMVNNALSTHAFLRTCRKVSGIDPRSFAEQWIYGSGCPTFGFSASFNRKKMAVEIQMRQDAPAYNALEANEISKAIMKPVPFFEGQMTIRIHEADGTPYEHVLDIRSPIKRYEVPFNTKYKRVRRNTKRYLARQAAAQAAAEGDQEAIAAMDMVDMGFGLDIWEKEKERENWKVADWTEEDEQTMSGQTYEWIRIDADFEWIAAIAFDQKDYMWVSQLQRDRDVVAQYEAIKVLSKTPNPIISSTLTKTVLVSNYFFRIRCEAAQALVSCAIARMDWLGLFHLFKLFLRYCYEPEDPNQDLFTHTYVPRPNEFSDIAEYFVRKSLLQAVSRVRFENGKTPPVVRQFLIDQLRYNDNTSNPYSDALYICTIISSLACATVSTVPPERGEFVTTDTRPVMEPQDADLLKQALSEIDRYRSMDRLIPSVHNVVSIATIEFHMILSVANLVPQDARTLIPLTREGNYTQVRMAAFDSLFLTKWYTPNIMQYVLAVMTHDSSRVIRRHVARNACQSLALLVTMGELDVGKKSKSVLVEEDGVGAESKKESQKSEIDLMLKALRKDPEVGKNIMIRNFLLPVAMSPDLDREVRWCLLKLADLTIRADPEQPPKVMIHLPPTPVMETPPSLPLPKPPIKPQRTMSIKVGTPTIKSPLTPTINVGKLKLPGTGTRVDVNVRNPDAPTPRPDRRASNASFVVPKTPVHKKPEPKPVPKNVPKAQSGGMSTQDLVACRRIQKNLIQHKSAPLFRQPVDPVRDRAPDYLQVIKNPMDLSTMNAKLGSGMYKDRFAFEQDFRLMVSNAKTYNAPKSYPYDEASKLEAYFEREWVRMNKTLEAKAASQKSMAPPAHIPSTPVAKPVPQPKAPATPQTPTPTPTSARPVIKLKMGPKTNGTPAPSPAPTSAADAPKPTPKLKLKKPKESKPAPPPPPAQDSYDDGGVDDDLLAEVIAIEKEKDQERKQRASAEKEREREKGRERLVKEKEKEKERTKERSREAEARERSREKERQAPPKVIIGKRKKTSPYNDPEEDEILALATPAKKERSTAASPAPIPIAGPSSERGSAKPSPAATPAPQPRNGISKPAREKETAPPRISIKGKEKDASSRGSTPALPKPKKPIPPQVTATPINEKKCKEILKTIQKLPDAAIFLQPVDPVRDGCPTYYDEIKNPMDFGTMSAKLAQGEYSSMEDFAKDFELVLANCRQFNPPTTYPVTCVEALEKAWKPLWTKAMQRKMQPSEKRSLTSLMNKLTAEPISFVFREPVDPVLLGIPTYFDVIPRKNARDLRTIRSKLDNDKYDSIDAFEAELDLMIDNALTFNGEESEVGQIALQMRDKYRDMVSALRGGKRKADKNANPPQPTKKARLT